MQVDDNLIDQFHRDGVVCIRNAFSKNWIDSVSRGVDKVRKNPSIWSESLSDTGSDRAYFNDYCQWKRVPEFVDFVFHSPAAQIVAQLLHSQYISFYHEHVLIKDAGVSKKTPWHVDQTYYPINGDKACSIWMPLDAVPEKTTIEFVARSHRFGVHYRPRKFATTTNYPVLVDGMDEEYVDVPDIDEHRDEYDIVKWSVEPGDVIVFHMKTLHGAPANTTDMARRIVSTRWLGDDCTIASRPWTTSPPTLGGLRVGDMAISEEFPKVWSSEFGKLCGSTDIIL